VENKRAYSRALRLLSARAYSEEEIREKIADEASDSETEQIIFECRKKNYLNDESLAERLIEKHLLKSRGLHYILSILKKRKVRKDVIDSVKENFDFKREFLEAEKFFMKNRKKKKLSSLFFSLKTRGFSYPTLNRLMNIHRNPDE